MSQFDDVKIKWAGREYTVPSRRMMEAIARIEEHLTLADMAAAAEQRRMPMAKIAMAFASVLNMVKPEQAPQFESEDIYAKMMTITDAVQVRDLLSSLLGMMVPRSTLLASAGATTEGNAPAAVASRSSKKRSKRQSAAAG